MKTTSLLNRRLLTVFLPFLVFVIFFIMELFTLSDYGINWDEPIHYIRGQAFLRFFLTGKEDYKDLPRLRIHYLNSDFSTIPDDISYQDDRYFRRSLYQYEGSGYQFTFNYFRSGETGEAGHPPLNDILASLSNYIFYQKLGIAGDIEAYHLFVIFVSSLLVAVLFLFVASEFSIFVGLITVLSLVLYPLFLAESHFNIKDPVETAFYTLTIITFYKGITGNDWRWILSSAISGALAFGTKFNIFFAFLTIPLWLIVYTRGKLFSLKWPFSKKVTSVLFLYPVIVIGIFFASWPYLWDDPMRILNIFSYYKKVGYSTVYQQKEFLIFNSVNTYAIQWILFTTPLVILAFSLIGIFSIFREGLNRRNKRGLLILLWFFIPIIRVSLPNAGIYGGVRQIMEYVPAMAILAGIGARDIVKLLYRCIVKQKIVQQFNNSTIETFLKACIILMFIPITFKLISIHPNENAYFNPLIGGLKGAKERNFQDFGTTLGSAYQQGIDWINKNAETHARLSLVRGLLSNVPSIKLRQDIYLDNKYYSGPERKGEYLMEVIDYRWPIDVSASKRAYIETLRTVYEVKVDDVTILAIWKND